MSNKPKIDPQTLMAVMGTIRSFAEAMRDPKALTQEQVSKINEQAFDAKSKLLAEMAKR